MKTTASNRKVHQIISAVRDGDLEIRPAFQRRLVWKNKDKCNFIQTVLDEYPFPEIYVATGQIDLETGEGTEVLVDGQQRVSTLIQYFEGSDDIKLGKDLLPYSRLHKDKKKSFLHYDVVTRDLGSLSDEDIRDVFQRINSTGYSLNAMEINNSRFDGEFKLTAETIAESEFFSDHRIFSANEIRRMEDTRFILVYMITIMSTYFHRDTEVVSYLETYNEEFRYADTVDHEIEKTLAFIEDCNFAQSSRVWKRADIFTLMVESHRALVRNGLSLNSKEISKRLKDFYNLVDSDGSNSDLQNDATTYLGASQQDTNSRSNRIRRGEIIRNILTK